mmetsp:Transcript_70672/g.228916  ORF Transcript_70672/g.228916 Transcript_70672/m.228916 type:complete len:90 (-) Transcript_70672:1320-1589(-)
MPRSVNRLYTRLSSTMESALVASSNTTIEGWCRMARTAATRCCSPRESTRVQSRTASNPSSKRSGRSPRPSSSSMERRSLSMPGEPLPG